MIRYRRNIIGIPKIPCNFPDKQGFGARDWFAHDWFLRQDSELRTSRTELGVVVAKIAQNTGVLVSRDNAIGLQRPR